MTGGRGRFFFVAATCAALSTFAGPARGDNGRVILVRPSTATPDAREAVSRIEGELAAEGFDVTLVDPLQAGANEPENVPDAGALARIAFSMEADGRSAELRVVDLATNKTVIRRIAIDAPVGSRAEVLAVRAVELLRASLLELLVRAHGPIAAAPPVAPAPVTDKAAAWAGRDLVPARRQIFGLEAGTAFLLGFGGIGPALLGAVRARAALRSWLQLRVTVAGLGTAPRVTSPSYGTARVTQDLGLVEIAAKLAEHSVVHPTFSAGVGPFYVGVEGQATFPYAGEQSSGWALAVAAGAGIDLDVAPHFDLSFEVHAMFTQPADTLRFVGQERTNVSEPTILATVTVVGWL